MAVDLGIFGLFLRVFFQSFKQKKSDTRGLTVRVSMDSAKTELQTIQPLNLRWIVTEVVHSVNNFLSGVEYSVHFIREDPGLELEENLSTIQERTRNASVTLRALYDLTSPLSDPQQALTLQSVLDRTRNLLLKKLQSQRVEMDCYAPEDLEVTRKDGQVICQFLYTYLWYRLSQQDTPCVFRCLADRDESGVWLTVEDPAEPDESLQPDRLLAVAQQEVDTSHRERFAYSSIGWFWKSLVRAGAEPVRKKGFIRFRCNCLAMSA